MGLRYGVSPGALDARAASQDLRRPRAAVRPAVGRRSWSTRRSTPTPVRRPASPLRFRGRIPPGVVAVRVARSAGPRARCPGADAAGCTGASRRGRRAPPPGEGERYLLGVVDGRAWLLTASSPARPTTAPWVVDHARVSRSPAPPWLAGSSTDRSRPSGSCPLWLSVNGGVLPAPPRPRDALAGARLPASRPFGAGPRWSRVGPAVGPAPPRAVHFRCTRGSGRRRSAAPPARLSSAPGRTRAGPQSGRRIAGPHGGPHGPQPLRPRRSVSAHARRRVSVVNYGRPSPVPPWSPMVRPSLPATRSIAQSPPRPSGPCRPPVVEDGRRPGASLSRSPRQLPPPHRSAPQSTHGHAPGQFGSDLALPRPGGPDRLGRSARRSRTGSWPRPPVPGHSRSLSSVRYDPACPCPPGAVAVPEGAEGSRSMASASGRDGSRSTRGRAPRTADSTPILGGFLGLAIDVDLGPAGVVCRPRRTRPPCRPLRASRACLSGAFPPGPGRPFVLGPRPPRVRPAGIGRHGLVDDQVDRMARIQGDRRLRQVCAVQARGAVDRFRRHQVAHHRAGAAGGDRHVGTAGEFHQSTRVPLGQRQRHVASHRRHCPDLHLRRSERQQDRDGVILAGIGVDDDAVRRGHLAGVSVGVGSRNRRMPWLTPRPEPDKAATAADAKTSSFLRFFWHAHPPKYYCSNSQGLPTPVRPEQDQRQIASLSERRRIPC